ncbi:guanine nucleotide binding protein, alpha subunit [Boletus edulis]|uniref:Guanine nucleotide binding protein, alpha subunit n=1 Tax=Boletus edulis BED1 TaxID=1328754 RepID=A0AAD4BUW1_BOLED|nr:guanine nucleotide binding protein, alpha subunit [Boletus edulis]KAF8440013.1 guanine nucleotide binding protein, alpha subunit [Boletus edulis BED1]
MGRSGSDDPFAFILAPPHDETFDEKETRERAEAEARRVSDSIDEQLRQERVALKKKKKPVKVLLLGQSESGKSATLKNFQLQYARHEWAEDRTAWRTVIFLNLIRNVIHVLDVLLREMSLLDGDKSFVGLEYTSDSDWEPSSHTPVYTFTDKHRLLKLRLAPLRRVLTDLEKRLGPGTQEVYTTIPTEVDKDQPREFGIISRDGWKSAFEKLRPARKDDSAPEPIQKRREEENYQIADILVGCKDDMKNLWDDIVVQQILAHRKAHIEDSPGFFLNDVERIASSDYKPCDDDIIRARLRTVGVQEHKFVMEEGQGREWVMYDVGGTRSSRAVWASFFDDVDTIIFLSPISCFDEKLREDSRVNRLEDSYQLWRSVCSSPMLAKTQIIIFLNKCDLLHRKLKRGVRVCDFIPSFGDRKNDTSTVMKYFQSHFKEISKLVSPEPRPFFVHFTSIIDTKATAATLSVVEESILRTYLRNADLL